MKPVSCADFSPKIIEFTTERVASLGLDNRITTQVADATDLSNFKVHVYGV